MKFKDQYHEKFFNDCLRKCHNDDEYHQALFYTLGLTETTRRIINDLYDFKSNCIRPEGIHSPAQTGSSVKVTRLAFNLYTGSVPNEPSESVSDAYTPSELFCCSLMPWMLEAVRIRYYYENQDI